MVSSVSKVRSPEKTEKSGMGPAHSHCERFIGTGSQQCLPVAALLVVKRVKVEPDPGAMAIDGKQIVPAQYG